MERTQRWTFDIISGFCSCLLLIHTWWCNYIYYTSMLFDEVKIDFYLVISLGMFLFGQTWSGHWSEPTWATGIQNPTKHNNSGAPTLWGHVGTRTHLSGGGQEVKRRHLTPPVSRFHPSRPVCEGRWNHTYLIICCGGEPCCKYTHGGRRKSIRRDAHVVQSRKSRECYLL